MSSTSGSTLYTFSWSFSMTFKSLFKLRLFRFEPRGVFSEGGKNCTVTCLMSSPLSRSRTSRSHRGTLKWCPSFRFFSSCLESICRLSCSVDWNILSLCDWTPSWKKTSVILQVAFPFYCFYCSCSCFALSPIKLVLFLGLGMN